MNAEFNLWLLIVGLVIGAGLVWLVLADSSRREVDVDRRERAGEARWIADELRRAGVSVTDETVADVLDLHATYLGAPPPDEPPESEPVDMSSPADPPAAWVQTDDRWPATSTSNGGPGGVQRPAMAHPTGKAAGDGEGPL